MSKDLLEWGFGGLERADGQSKGKDVEEIFREAGEFLFKEGMRPSNLDSTHVFQATGQFLKEMGYTRPEIKLDTWYIGSIENGFEEL